jgi:transcriptional regulator with XRE-family HTH domain
MNHLAIIDVTTIRAIMKEVRQRVSHQREGARTLGISQATFNRLLRGTGHKRISTHTFRSIRDALRRNVLGLEPPKAAERQRAFESTVLTEAGWHARRHYGRWLRDELRQLTPKVQSLFTLLFSDVEYRGVFGAFLKQVNQSPDLPRPNKRRIWLALYRSVEPLSDAEATWGVERKWREMRAAGDLRRYLEVALEREHIMLKRERDIVRINKCTLPPDIEEEFYTIPPPDEEEPRLDAREEFSADLEEPQPTEES